jgi:hypothetical protein
MDLLLFIGSAILEGDMHRLPLLALHIAIAERHHYSSGAIPLSEPVAAKQDSRI